MRPATTRARGIASAAVLAVAVGALTTTSCRQRHESAAADSTFVRAMGDLRLLASNAALDSAARARGRDSILRRYATTAGDLERIATEMAQDPDHAVAVLRKIDLRARPGPPPTAGAVPVLPQAGASRAPAAAAPR